MVDIVRTPPPEDYPGKIYVGVILEGQRRVYVRAAGAGRRVDTETCSPLNPRDDLHPFHHRDAFDWGRVSVGAWQLALALLADAYEDDELACRLYRRLARAFVVPLPADRPWWLTYDRLDAILARIESEVSEKRRFTEL